MPLSSYTGGICIIDNFCSKMSTGSNTSGSQPTSAPRLPWLPLMLCLGALFLAVAIYSWRQRAKVTSLLQKGCPPSSSRSLAADTSDGPSSADDTLGHAGASDIVSQMDCWTSATSSLKLLQEGVHYSAAVHSENSASAQAAGAVCAGQPSYPNGRAQVTAPTARMPSQTSSLGLTPGPQSDHSGSEAVTACQPFSPFTTLASTTNSTLTGCVIDSDSGVVGSSSCGPADAKAVVESIKAVAGLGGRAARYKPRSRVVQLHMKIPFVEPHHLPADWLQSLNKAMAGIHASSGYMGATAGQGSGEAAWHVVGAAVRRGCIQLQLELRGPALPAYTPLPLLQATATDRHGSVEADDSDSELMLESMAFDHACSSTPAGGLLSGGLPAGLLSAMGLAVAAQADSSSQGAHVLVQAGRELAVLQWQGACGRVDGAGWKMSHHSSMDTGVSSGCMPGILDAPIAVTAPLPGQPLLLHLHVCGWDGSSPLIPLPRALTMAMSGAVPASLQLMQPAKPHFIISAHGRSMRARVVGSTMLRGVPSCASPAAASAHSTGTLSGAVVQVALKVDYWGMLPGQVVHHSVHAAPAAPAAPCVVLRVALQVGPSEADALSVAVVDDAQLAAELAGVPVAGTQQAGAGAAGPDAANRMHGVGARLPGTQDLLADLGHWSAYLAAMRAAQAVVSADTASAAAAAGHPPPATTGAGPELVADGQGDPLSRVWGVDLSHEAAQLLTQPGVQAQMLPTGCSLLAYALEQAFPSLASRLVQQLVQECGMPLARLLAPVTPLIHAADGVHAAHAQGSGTYLAGPFQHGVPVGDDSGSDVEGDEYDEEQAHAVLGLMHHAVRSGSLAIVQTVLRWVGELGGEQAGSLSNSMWLAPGPHGLTPLHMLAARAGTGSAGGLAMAAWVLAHCRHAAQAWRSVVDQADITPAQLASALGAEQLSSIASATLTGTPPFTTPAGTRITGHGTGGRSTVRPAAHGASSFRQVRTEVAAPTCALACTEALPSEGSMSASLQAQMGVGLLGALRVVWCGFTPCTAEAVYAGYVTHTTRSAVLVWVWIMLLAHAAAAVRSLQADHAIQVAIGIIGYALALLLHTSARPLYDKNREALMALCMLGRTVSRACIAFGLVSMAPSVQQYVKVNLDILLDGVMEGWMESMRLPLAGALRLLEFLVLVVMYNGWGWRTSVLGAAARASLPALVGLGAAALADLRARRAFVAHMARQEQAAAIKAKKAA